MRLRSSQSDALDNFWKETSSRIDGQLPTSSQKNPPLRFALPLRGLYPPKAAHAVILSLVQGRRRVPARAGSRLAVFP